MRAEFGRFRNACCSLETLRSSRMYGYGRPMNSGQVFGLAECFAKLWYTKKINPAIHLDNRYRLMRHEPMLDADGKETNEIGEDDSVDIEDLLRAEEKDLWSKSRVRVKSLMRNNTKIGEVAILEGRATRRGFRYSLEVV
ncbi:hypothetical protein V1478_017170, partial [Vespula squamosa]